LTALTEFLFPAPAERSTRAILAWWEARRPHYNLIVGTAGLFSLGVLNLLGALPPAARPPGVPWPVIVVFGGLANVCYLFGPAVEIGLQRLWQGRVLPAGPTLFRMGLTFSAGLALLPSLLGTMDWLIRLVRWLL
jgi:hypothetical protein